MRFVSYPHPHVTMVASGMLPTVCRVAAGALLPATPAKHFSDRHLSVDIGQRISQEIFPTLLQPFCLRPLFATFCYLPFCYRFITCYGFLHSARSPCL